MILGANLAPYSSLFGGDRHWEPPGPPTSPFMAGPDLLARKVPYLAIAGWPMGSEDWDSRISTRKCLKKNEMGISIVMGVLPNGWFIMENVSDNWWFGGTPIYVNPQVMIWWLAYDFWWKTSEMSGLPCFWTDCSCFRSLCATAAPGEGIDPCTAW